MTAPGASFNVPASVTYSPFRHLLPAAVFAAFVGLTFSASAQTAPGESERPPTDDERPGESHSSSSHDALLEPAGPELPVMPPRILGALGGGVSFRGVKDPNFAQKWFAPSYLDITGSYVFAGAGTWRHGVSLSLGTNLSGDGNRSIGLDAVQQFTLIPSYLAYFRFSDDFIFNVRAGVALSTTFNVQADKSIGFEVSAQGQYMLTAGAGLYVQVSGDMFFGTAWSTHPMLSVGGGLVVDYEVLP